MSTAYKYIIGYFPPKIILQNYILQKKYIISYKNEKENGKIDLPTPLRKRINICKAHFFN